MNNGMTKAHFQAWKDMSRPQPKEENMNRPNRPLSEMIGSTTNMITKLESDLTFYKGKLAAFLEVQAEIPLPTEGDVRARLSIQTVNSHV